MIYMCVCVCLCVIELVFVFVFVLLKLSSCLPFCVSWSVGLRYVFVCVSLYQCNMTNSIVQVEVNKIETHK